MNPALSYQMCSHVTVDHRSNWKCSDSDQQSLKQRIIDDEISVSIEGEEMWCQLRNETHEMIIGHGSQGRRMFPNCNLRITNLRTSAYYSCGLEVRAVDGFKYAFDNASKGFVKCGIAESDSSKRMYRHTDSLILGQGLMRGPVSFKTLKFTTARDTDGTVLELKLGQRYMLVLHLIEHSDDMEQPNKCLEIPLPVTEFITVTAINNMAVESIKNINRNNGS